MGWLNLEDRGEPVRRDVMRWAADDEKCWGCFAPMTAENIPSKSFYAIGTKDSIINLAENLLLAGWVSDEVKETLKKELQKGKGFGNLYFHRRQTSDPDKLLKLIDEQFESNEFILASAKQQAETEKAESLKKSTGSKGDCK